MFSTTIRKLCAAISTVAVTFGGGAPAPVAASRPNVLFIGFDALSDWIQPLDPTSPIVMPNLDRLARRGVLFRRAYCAAPECNPSRTALFSGATAR